MLAWSARSSAISSRPVRAAEPRRFMLSEEGGVGTTSCSSRRFFLARGAFAAFRVATAFFDLEDACFDELLLGAALRRRADARAGFAAFFVGFPAFGRLARVDLAALFRAPDF